VDFGNPRDRLEVLRVEMPEVLQFFNLMSGQLEICLDGFQAIVHGHSFADDIGWIPCCIVGASVISSEISHLSHLFNSFLSYSVYRLLRRRICAPVVQSL
jgi:hypothetical protein